MPTFTESHSPPGFEQWRNDARAMLAQEVSPEYASFVSLRDESPSLFDALEMPKASPARMDLLVALKRFTKFSVPSDFIERAPYVFAFRSDDSARFLYRVLWRITHGEPNLLKVSIDRDTAEFESRYRLVKRDLHKMKAFVRFREVDGHFIAWHRPDHFVVRLAAPFFVERFNGMRFSIMTADECMHWNQNELTFTEGLPASAAPREDAAEDLWKTYYASIFNPARTKLKAMTKEMPVRHWKTMPETALIQELLRTSPERLQKFFREQNPTAEKWLPTPESGHALTLLDLKAALPNCQACGICEKSNGPVMGEGPLGAEIGLIGEQPGEEEDKQGKPFIGPAGQLLDDALQEIGLNRDALYVTNAVKAFKWTEKIGYGRIHRGSTPTEIAACNPWLKKELGIVKPKKIVCLGRSAAQAVLGRSVLMREVRGKFFETPYSKQTLVIPHPSFILRIQDEQQRFDEFARFVEELRMVISA